MPTARDVMHAGVQCVDENESLQKAAEMMAELDVGSLPICGTDQRLKGIITDRDIVVKCCARGRNPADMKAADLAQGTITWIDADADLDEALTAMEDQRIRRLPVIEDRRLVGVISEADLARALPEERLAHFVERVYA